MQTETLVDQLNAQLARGQGDLACTLLGQGEELGLPEVSDRLTVQALYVAMRLAGESHMLAEMFALSQPPQIRTDNTFMEGHCNGNQFEDKPWLGDWYAAQAKEAGVDITGAVYLSGMARFPGDPEAWVRGRGDVQRLCEERGWGCQGAVQVKRNDFEPPAPDVDVADDIVFERALDMIETNPDLERRPQGEVLAEAKASLLPT